MTLPVETEIKLPVTRSLAAVRRKLGVLGFRVHARRIFESNTIFDTADMRLRRAGELLRIRRVGREALLTFKGPPQAGRHKVREEIETRLDNGDAMRDIFERLGLAPVFCYEKYRAEYTRSNSRGIVTVDETPIGNYLELEGPPKWIDSTARELGYSESAYITASYAGLYLEYCRKHGIEPSNMTFGGAPRRRTPDR